MNEFSNTPVAHWCMQSMFSLFLSFGFSFNRISFVEHWVFKVSNIIIIRKKTLSEVKSRGNNKSWWCCSFGFHSTIPTFIIRGSCMWFQYGNCFECCWEQHSCVCVCLYSCPGLCQVSVLVCMYVRWSILSLLLLSWMLIMVHAFIFPSWAIYSKSVHCSCYFHLSNRPLAVHLFLVIVRTLSIQLKFIRNGFSANALDAESRQPRARPAIAEPNFVCTFFVNDLTACCSCYIFKWSAVLRT